MSLTRQSTKSLTHGVEIVFGVVYKIFFLSSLVVNVILCFLFTGIMYYSHSRKQFSRVILIIFCLTMFLYTHETYTDWLIIYAQGHQSIPGLLIILSIAIFCVEVIVIKKYHTLKEMIDPGRQEVNIRKDSINTSNYDMKQALKEMRRARRKKENQERNPSTVCE
ncbi:unnamed protein product, partial [Mesorhabditis belari]|uniref:Uncharacterized protein n=1 Tax=Mesorhabditis belari TaxID=2138241 RepID=A0AAF3FD73_9BILA